MYSATSQSLRSHILMTFPMVCVCESSALRTDGRSYGPGVPASGIRNCPTTLYLAPF